MTNTKSYILIITLAIFFPGCTKFLDEKSNKKLVIPETIQDLQALLDRYTHVSQRDAASGEVSADDYYLTYSSWQGGLECDRRIYTWEKGNLFQPGIGNDWANCYDNIYRANLVLDNLDKIKRTKNDNLEWNFLKGHALFVRARSFLQVAGIWAQAYNPISAETDMGIPLRLNPDFNEVSKRSTVKQTYERIVGDFKEAASLLPPTPPASVLRPSKPAAYAYLARTFLYMQQYELAKSYADSALLIKNDLLDFNTISVPATRFSFAPRFSNPEIIFEAIISSTSTSNFLSNTRAIIDSSLYKSYLEGDLRKTLFFISNNNGTYRWRGSYVGANICFSGIATDELYLIRAECYARRGMVAEATNDLNTLMEKRWDASIWTPFNPLNADEALAIILTERRKELLMRGLRWMDIKRLNADGASINLSRVLDGQSFNLPANSNRFALSIPEDVIKYSGMMQNP